MLCVAVLVIIGLMLNASTSHAAIASCYGPGLYGNRTANGTVLTTSTLGIAHKTLPLGTRLKLRSNGRTISVTVIDRGPYVAGRAIDLTEASTRQLGYPTCTAWGHRSVRTWRAR